MFRRRRRTDDDPIEDEELLADDEEVAADEADAAAAPGGLQGPWDEADAPAEPETGYLDLGGLRLPVLPGMEARVDVDQESQQIVAATLVDGQTALQVNAFAAPRSAGIWAEVRTEIADSLRQNGGTADEADGPFGTELVAQVPSEVPGQGVVLQPARFLGVDGPRWFLRGLMSGQGAVERPAAARLEQAFAGVVVVRGGEAMAPRDPLPLRLPREAVEAMENQGQQADGGDGLDPFERGPEITEVR